MIHPSARLGAGVTLGENIVIGMNVKIGDGCIVGHGVVIHTDTEIGNEVKIGDNTVVGRLPMRAKMSAVTKDEIVSPAFIGEGVLIGSQTVIHRGSRIGNFVLVADLASVRENVEIGDYSIVGRGVAVENEVTIGKRCKIETNAYICAFSTIEDYCFVAPMVTFTNDNFLGRGEARFKGPHLKVGARLGANATILPQIVIGEDALIAAGSVVTKNVPPRKVVIGVPARVIRDVPREQLIENQMFYGR